MTSSPAKGTALQELPDRAVDAPAATVALVGPPNCGKSTLFNRLTGLRQKTGNFPGVTVERHHGTVRLSGGGSWSFWTSPGPTA